MTNQTRVNVDLRCPQCGSECRWLDDVSTKVCLHCGYREKLTDSDAVQKARIAANKEIELAKLQQQKEESERKSALKCLIGMGIAVAILFIMLLLIDLVQK